MKKFFLRVLLLALFTALGYLGWRTRELQRDNLVLREAVSQLESERRALQQQVNTGVRVPKPEEQAASRAEIEKQTSALRGLKFQKPVEYRLIERSKMRELLVGEIRKQYTEQEIRDYGRSLAAMGLIPEGTDVMQVLLSLYDEQVGAFYLPEEHHLYTFQDTTLGRALDRMFLSHELTHALQDQNFHLTNFPLRVKDDDDRVLAAMALIEGDATLLMSRYYADNLDPRNMLQDLGAMLGQNTEKLMKAPAYLRDSLLFPYTQGQQFATALFAEGGTEALDAAFRKLPVSSEEILHPDKFQKNRREPARIEMPEFKVAGWRQIGNNTLGEFGIRSLLGDAAAAEGWNGDRYHVYEQGTNGPVAFIWITEWDTEQDAIEFETTYNRWLKQRSQTAIVTRTGAQVAIQYPADLSFFRPPSIR